MRKLGSAVIVLGGVWLAPGASAQQPEAPDLDFLEYLGSWQGEDDEWLVIAEWEKDDPKKDGGRDADGDRPRPDRERSEDD
jgi:hypothetical protein